MQYCNCVNFITQYDLHSLNCNRACNKCKSFECLCEFGLDLYCLKLGHVPTWHQLKWPKVRIWLFLFLYFSLDSFVIETNQAFDSNFCDKCLTSSEPRSKQNGNGHWNQGQMKHSTKELFHWKEQVLWIVTVEMLFVTQVFCCVFSPSSN